MYCSLHDATAALFIIDARFARAPRQQIGRVEVDVGLGRVFSTPRRVRGRRARRSVESQSTRRRAHDQSLVRRLVTPKRRPLDDSRRRELSLEIRPDDLPVVLPRLLDDGVSQRRERLRPRESRFRRRRRSAPLILQIHIRTIHQLRSENRILLDRVPIPCAASVRVSPPSSRRARVDAPIPYFFTPRASASFSSSVHIRYPFRPFFRFYVPPSIRRRQSRVLPSRVASTCIDTRASFRVRAAPRALDAPRRASTSWA